MNRGGRLVVALLLLAGFAAAVYWLWSGSRSDSSDGGMTGTALLGPPPISMRELTLHQSSDCKGCHAEVFAEWEGSHHAIAYTNPEVQKLSKNFRDRDCLPCHSSRPVFETGLGNRVLEREVRLEEGVDCFTCHQFKNAMMGNPARLKAGSPAPCNPMPYAGVTDLGLCSPCHDQHKVIRDWRETEFADGATKKDCADCHMPPAERKATADRPAYTGRSHRFPAAHDPEMLRKAVSMTTAIDGEGHLLVTVKNDGAGHNVPADERHRAVDLVVEFRDLSGASAKAQVDRYRNPYRDEFHLKNPLRNPGDQRSYPVDFGRFGPADVVAKRVAAAFHPARTAYYPESTQIPAGESRTYAIAIPKDAVGMTAKLIYKLNPFVEDDQGTVLREESQELLGAARAPAPVARPSLPAPAPETSAVDRANRILADAKEKKAAFVPELLRMVKDKSHSAFILVPDAKAPFGLRVDENPFGGDDTRQLERIAAVAAIGGNHVTEGIPELLLALDDRDGLPAVQAAVALIGLGNRAGVPVLLKALEHKAYENEHANRILMDLSGQDFGFDSDIGMTARAAAVKRWNDWWAAFEKSGQKLKGEGEPYRKGQDPATDARIARYVNIAGEFQFVFMEQSRKMLRRLGAPAVPFLEEGVARAAGPEHATWRGEIAHVLGGIADPAAHRLLATLAADPHPAVRARAIDALAASGAPDAAERARSALQDPDASVVKAGIRSLARAGKPDDAALFASLKRTEPEVLLEIDLARLKMTPSTGSFDAVTRHLFDASIAARTAAMDALNALAGRVVLDDPNASEDARRAAIATWRTALEK